MSNAVDKGRAYPTHLYEHDIPTQAKKVLNVSDFNIGAYDYVERGWTAGTFTEVWTFYTGGSGGTLVATVTIIYDDVDKSNIVNVTKV